MAILKLALIQQKPPNDKRNGKALQKRLIDKPRWNSDSQSEPI
jgi:hypothetical protein